MGNALMGNDTLLTFGPVPSRRLGRSLGINNIPPKICSYSCSYCQVGRTYNKQIRRASFYDPQQILDAVRRKITAARSSGERVDYLTFVPDGEPTLDVNLGKSIAFLKSLDVRVAVITNASLVESESVRADLMLADWVSLKVDAVRLRCWRKINRPHRGLGMNRILNGMVAFSKSYRGTLTTETMLVGNTCANEAVLKELAAFIGNLNPAVGYLSVPTRPPAEPRVAAPLPEALNRAYQIFTRFIQRVEYLVGYEGDAFAATGNPAADLLSITAVHPMRKEAVRQLLEKSNHGFSVVEKLIHQGKIIQTEYGEHTYYLRNLNVRQSNKQHGFGG